MLFISFIALFFQYKNSYDIYLYFIKKSKNKQNSLESELLEVKSEIMNLKKENESLSKYKEIYNKIGKTYNIKAFLEIKYINNNQNGRYVIAKTNNNNVYKNDLVVDDYGILIGRIIHVDKNIVKIQLITDYRSSLPVSVNGIDGIINGTNNQDCPIVFENFNKLKPNDKDLVLTSLFNGLILSGVIAGRIKTKNDNICVENDNVKNIKTIMVVS